MLRLAHVFLVGLLLYPVTAAPQFARAQIVRAAPTYVEPTLIFTCSSYSYYRPAISADGAYVIFESTPNGGTATNLVIDAFPTNPPTNCADHFPTPFISTGVTAGSQRADWCWDRSAGGKPKNGPVAFSNGDGIFTATPNGMNSVPATGMTNTAEMIYPSWYPDCRKLAVDVWQPNPQVNGRQWVIAQIDLTGHVTAYPLGGDAVWAGFPSVNQQNPSVVAFAGQSNGQQNGIAAYYNQNINYIWVAGGQGKYIRTVPLERNIDVNLGFLPIFQARAGWWSPDGNWFAFESNRYCNNIEGDIYAIFIIDSAGLRSPMQVSDCNAYNVQHPKWLPARWNGVSTTLVAAVAPASDPQQFSIGIFDVTEYVK